MIIIATKFQVRNFYISQSAGFGLWTLLVVATTTALKAVL